MQKNLPNKRNIGKQDPYCTLEFNREKRRTKAIKRGGQHPEWDEEIRFTLYEDPGESTAAAGDGTPPPPPPKKDSEKRIKGGKALWVACYADDPKEPDLIGEAKVDLTEVLTKGETDGGFKLSQINGLS
jgi:neural Wiskott-Aldrich syndrome protein